MTIYDIPAVEEDVPNSSQAIELDLVGQDKVVLDVGCSTGYLARALNARGCTVSGVELEPEAAELARDSLHELLVADLDVVYLAQELAGRRYDSIVFGDILEHVRDADRVLKAAVTLLADDGSVVISVPNVTHGSLRLALLQGRWDYVDSGLLDRTHLRFFTRESVLAMVRDAGLVVTDLRATVLDPLGCEVEIDADGLPGAIVDWVRHQPDALVYQFVLRAVVGTPDGVVPELVPAVPLPVVEDVYTERARIQDALHRGTDGRSDLVAEVMDLRRRLLTLRDHAIGAEATVGTARAAAEQARAEAERARAEVVRVAAAGVAEAELLRTTNTWRVGHRLVSPLARVKRLIQGTPGR